MEAQSNKVKVYEVDALKGNFYDPLLERLNDPTFSKSMLNDTSIDITASEILTHPQFSLAYRDKMVNCLKKQYQQSGINLAKDSPVLQNIEKLALENTLTVTTGQQIHIFLGPFFVVNKLLSCCAEAKEYGRMLPNNNVVPVFWMATEDHDFDEIRSSRLYNEIYQWEVESNGPVGRLKPSSLLELVNQAKLRIDQTEENLEFLNICGYAYEKCENFADATRYIIHHYFEKTGVVVIDPDSAFFKSQFQEITQADLVDHTPSQSIDSSIASLKKFGIKAPINTRPINTFYLTNSARNRIEQNESGGYNLIGTDNAFSKEELLNELATNPERFSPNALLRPVYQQQILPNIHYVCGASEIKYWMELKSVMTLFDLTFPKLSIRKSMFFLSEKNIQKLDTDKIPLNDLFLSTNLLTEKIVTSQENELLELNDQIKAVNDNTTAVLETLGSFDASKIRKAQNITNQLLTELNAQQNALISEKSGSNLMLNRVLKIKANLYSEAYVQERNKYIVGMVNELHIALSCYAEHDKYYLNHHKILVVGG